MKQEDMDIIGACYGLRYLDNCGSPNGCIEFFTEDDEIYHRGWTSFNHIYIPDMIRMLQTAYEHFTKTQ